MNEGSTAVHVADEAEEHTFQHPENFRQVGLMRQAAWITVSKANKTTHVLDFGSYRLKGWNSTDLMVQNTLNRDTNLESKHAMLNPNRPDQTKLRNEIINRKQDKLHIASDLVPDYPDRGEDTFSYLGMTLHRATNT